MTPKPVFYVLRERSTKRLLPIQRGAGRTRVEFGDNGPPRLFTTRAAASSALACWRMGVWRMTGDEDSVYSEPPDPRNKWAAETIALRKDVLVDIIGVRLVPELLTRLQDAQGDPI